MRASSSSFIRPTSLPFSRYVPLLGVSRQPMRFISVDFPEPDGPMIATNSPRSMSTDTPLSAWTDSAPMRYVFQRSSVWISAISQCLLHARYPDGTRSRSATPQ